MDEDSGEVSKADIKVWEDNVDIDEVSITMEEGNNEEARTVANRARLVSR